MSNHTYSISEIVGTSNEGVDAAVRNGIAEAAKTLRNLTGSKSRRSAATLKTGRWPTGRSPSSSGSAWSADASLRSEAAAFGATAAAFGGNPQCVRAEEIGEGPRYAVHAAWPLRSQSLPPVPRHHELRSADQRGRRHAIMDAALDAGINFFDTANVYGWRENKGRTEEILGRWFAKGGERREQDGARHQGVRHHGRTGPTTTSSPRSTSAAPSTPASSGCRPTTSTSTSSTTSTATPRWRRSGRRSTS